MGGCPPVSKMDEKAYKYYLEKFELPPDKRLRN